MPSLPQISITIITLNEEKNLDRCLKSVRGLSDDIWVIDSGSTDQTKEIALRNGAHFLNNPWLGYGQQKNFAHSKTKHPWVLSLDADECLTEEARGEIIAFLNSEKSERRLAARFARKTWYLNRWILYGGWYPNYQTRLYRKDLSKWSEPEIHEKLVHSGEAETLAGEILHYSFPSISDQVQTNLKFSALGYRALKRAGRKPSVLLILLKPISKFLETYIFKLGFLDGLAGFIISINAAHSIFLKYSYLFEGNPNENSGH